MSEHAAAIARLSPVAHTYKPVDACSICNAPLHRTEIVDHEKACLRIEAGLAYERRPLIPPARRRRGIAEPQ